MNGFAAAARKEEEPIRATLENRWAHPSILPAFQLPRYSAIRLTMPNQPRADKRPAARRLRLEVRPLFELDNRDSRLPGHDLFCVHVARMPQAHITHTQIHNLLAPVCIDPPDAPLAERHLDVV